jgi:molybdate/tungstate transport system substrate-binding protein
VGYHTLLAWRLAEKSAAYGTAAVDLQARLAARCAREHVAQDEAELMSLLEARAIDYAFMFRSTAEDHHLKITELPAEENLSRPELAASYAAAQVEVRMKQGEGRAVITGGPVTYGVTVPANAPHPEPARRFLAMLLGDVGRRILERRGFRPVRPAVCEPCTDFPAELRALVSSPP